MGGNRAFRHLWYLGTDARGLAHSALDEAVKLGGMNEFHAAAKQADTRVISF
jgi:hypothetical protein